MSQLIKKNSVTSDYDKVYPNTLFDGVLDNDTGMKLKDFLLKFNSFYIPFSVNREITRLQIPESDRKRGMWITYYMPKANQVVTEYYDNDKVSDSFFKKDSNWVSLKEIIKKEVLVQEKYHTIFSEAKYKIEGTYDTLTADRAIGDAFGRPIHDTYLTREGVANYVDSVISDFVQNWKYEIPDGTITYDMLSEALKELFETAGGTITNFPDEEDITVKDNVLKFKDRTYDDESFSGLGYKILRKNIADNINLLEQADISEPYTIYEIRYDFCLNGNTITIPENSILYFHGGTFNNGKIILQNTLVWPNVCNIKEYLRTEIEGDWREGQVVYDEDDNVVKVFNGTEWIIIGISYNELVETTQDLLKRVIALEEALTLKSGE